MLESKLGGLSKSMILRCYYDTWIDELYSEILYEILHSVGGCDKNNKEEQQTMLSYVQDAFKMTNDKHTELLTAAEGKKPPELMLNVEVVEAKDLVSKSTYGLSDPYVVIYMMSNSNHRYNSSVKQSTLNPVWEEHFSLPMQRNLHDESLCLEVWDFDPAETVKNKMTKIFEVKGVRGLRKLVKDIAITASNGKSDNELIGTANIPLKCLPAGGMTMWVNLSKKSKQRRQGVVKVRLNFSSEKNSQAAAQEHRHLLRIFLNHELENSKVAPYWWSGNFSALAEAILAQHAAQSGLNQQDNVLAQWTVFCAITLDYPLSYSLFNNLLDKISKSLKSGLINDKDDIKRFWEGARKLLPTCFTFIIKLRQKVMDDYNLMKTLNDVLNILQKLSTLDIPENLDLFPDNLYDWLGEDKGKLTIHEMLHEAVSQGASDWFDHIMDNNESNEENEGAKLQELIRLLQLVRSDLQRAVTYYDRVFIDIMNFSYPKTLYALYESKIAIIFEPIIKEVCKRGDCSNSLKSVGKVNGESAISALRVKDEPTTTRTDLFDLYLRLERFLMFGQGLNEADWNSYAISKYHSWFFGCMAQWLDIAAFEALTMIERAIELDSLTPLDGNVKYSSSGVDTLTIFHQIKFSWQQLSWPDVEERYTFAAKIVDDICHCLVFYSDRMSNRIESVGLNDEHFEVTSEWCVAINNIDHVQKSLQPFVDELGMEDIVQKLGEARSPIEAQRCKETMDKIIENAIENIRKAIKDALIVMVKKMMSSITLFLVEGAKLLHQDSSSMDRLMLYLEKNLNTLYKHLNDENFSQTLDIIWEQVGANLQELIQTSIEKHHPPSYFSNLNECLKVMVRSLQKDDQEDYSSEILKQVEHLLVIHGMETRELIHQYHLKRWQEQQAVSESTMLGVLTIRVQFMKDELQVEIMNARNLKSSRSNGQCDSYAKVTLVPKDLFTNFVKYKTKTHAKNQFPLYDETIKISLTQDQRNISNGLIHFVIKDKDMFSMNNHIIGEAYLHFSEVVDTPDDISSLPQILLTLTRPTSIDQDVLQALEPRQGDKKVRNFLKKQKLKLLNTN